MAMSNSSMYCYKHAQRYTTKVDVGKLQLELDRGSPHNQHVTNSMY